jgi:hypothetical protein
MQLLIALSSTGKDLLVTCEDADSAFALLCLAKDVTEHLVARHRSDVVGVCNDVFSALCTLCDSITLLRDGVSSATLLDLRSVLFLSAIDNLTTFTKSLPSNPKTHLLMPSLVRFLYKHGTHLAKNSRTEDSVTLLVTLLEISNALIPQTSKAKLNSLAFEMLTITNEALYIIAFYYGTDSQITSPTRRDEANVYLGIIERNIKLQRQSVADAEAGYSTDAQTRHSKATIGCEVAKVRMGEIENYRRRGRICQCSEECSFDDGVEIIRVKQPARSTHESSSLKHQCTSSQVKFARAMMALSWRDHGLATKLLEEMIAMPTTVSNQETYELCLSGIRTVSFYIVKNEDNQNHAAPDLFDTLLAKLPTTDGEKVFKLKSEQVRIDAIKKSNVILLLTTPLVAGACDSDGYRRAPKGQRRRRQARKAEEVRAPGERALRHTRGDQHPGGGQQSEGEK